MKKSMLLFGMALCVIALAGVVATSYYNGTTERVVTADKAVILSLNGSDTIDGIILNENAVTVYNVTAKIDKSAGLSESVNATLKIDFTNESDIKTLSDLNFEICEKGSDTPLKSLNGNGTLTVTNISQTKEYQLKIRLRQKADGSRYTAEELKNVGGKFVVSFTTTEGGSNA